MPISDTLHRSTDCLVRRQPIHASIKYPNFVQSSNTDVKRPVSKLGIMDGPACKLKNFVIHFHRADAGAPVYLGNLCMRTPLGDEVFDTFDLCSGLVNILKSLCTVPIDDGDIEKRSHLGELLLDQKLGVSSRDTYSTNENQYYRYTLHHHDNNIPLEFACHK